MVEGPQRITRPFLSVVSTLLTADGELHGWAIARRTDLGHATVYKMLERLTATGWLTARWIEPEPGSKFPRRLCYQLTDDGARRAREILAERAS